MAEKVNTGIPIALSPEILSDKSIKNQFVMGSNSDGTVHHAALSEASNALQAAYNAAERLANVETELAAAAAAGAELDATSEARLRKGAKAQVDAARRAFDSGYVALADHKTALENQIRERLGIDVARTDIASVIRGGEFRQALRSMKTPIQRSEALREAITAQDSETVSYVLSTSPTLSGLGRDDFKTFYRAASQAFAPDETRISLGIDKVAQILKTADTALSARFEKFGAGSSASAKAQRAIDSLMDQEGSN